MRADSVGAVRHALLVVAGYGAFFCWLFGQLLFTDVYLAEADLYDWFLPLFLSPVASWSHEMFAGLPVFADTSDTAPYLVHALFARVLHSWNGYVISAYVLGAAFTYAYVFTVTRSRFAATCSGLAYGLSAAMLQRLGHINIVHASAWFPLMVLAIDRMLAGASRRWVATGALATAGCFLSGHPQPLVYAGSFCLLYALAGGLAERAPRRFYAGVAAMVALGALLTFAKSLPFLEVSRHMARTDMSYERFIDASPSPPQMLEALVFGPREGGAEAPLYVGLSVLTLAALGAGMSPWRWRARLWAAAAVFALLVTAGDATPVARLAYYLPLYGRFRIASRMLFVFAAAAAVLAGFALADLSRRRRAPVKLALGAFAAVAIAELLLNAPFAITPSGLRLHAIGAASLQPSVHATDLASRVAPAHQRLLAVGGTSRDPVVPSGFARLWRIPTAGGYSPIMSARLAALARMGAPGDVFPDVLAVEDRSLDLLAIRYILVGADDFPPPATFARGGVTWAEPSLKLSVGGPACGHRFPRATSLRLPPDLTVASIAMVGYLRCAENAEQGATVAHVEVIGADDARHTRPVVAGVDLADLSVSETAVRDRVRHTSAVAFDDPEIEPRPFVFRVDLPEPIRGARLALEAAGAGGWVTIERLTVIDADRRSHPQTLGPLLLRNPDRWREASRFRTSRITDRGADEDGPNEQEIRVYENLRAMPRAWIVSSVIEISEREAIETIRYSQLPDGRAFDPASAAIVDPGGGARSFSPGRAEARVTSIDEGRIVVEVDTEGGGYLVLSEAHYPGWRAQVGDHEAPVERVNVMFQGVEVPAGRHTVIFELDSTTLRVGIAVSVLALAYAMLLLWRG